MAYEINIDGLVLPIAPSKIDTKFKGNNKTVNLINDGDVNILKLPGLTEVSFDARLSYFKYPFAVNDLKPGVFLDKFESLMVSKRPCQLKVIRTTQNNRMLFSTDLRVSLEEYTIKEDAKDGTDIVVSLKFKQYRDYGTKIVKILEGEATLESQRNTDSAPDLKTYTVVKGDCLWNIAKKYLGDGSRYNEIYELNKDILSNPNKIYPGQVLKLPDSASSGSVSPTTSAKPSTSTTTTAKPNTNTSSSSTGSSSMPTKKVSVTINGASITKSCIVEYVIGKIKRSATHKQSFNVLVDSGSTVTITLKHTTNKTPSVTVLATPAHGWSKSSSSNAVVLTSVVEADSNVTVKWNN